MDKLIVTGLGKPLDGEYEFSFAGMLGIGTPEALTNREGHRIKVMSGVRAGELEDALVAADNDVLVAFAAIILARHGKTVDEEKLWDAPMGAGVSFELEQVEDDAEDPPTEPAEPPETETPPASGGKSSESTSASQENGQSPTGRPDSERSLVFDHLTSGS